jgi:hypothetical protein
MLLIAKATVSGPLFFAFDGMKRVLNRAGVTHLLHFRPHTVATLF